MITESEEHKLTIDTPEQVTLEFPIAGMGSRCMAFLIDTLIQWLLFIIVIMASAIIGIAAAPVFDGGTWMVAIAVLLLFVLYWGYFAAFEALWNGQTPGKRNVGIRVIKDTGRRITPFEAITRNLLRTVDALPGVYVVGLVTMAISRENRRIGDYVAGTVVVHERGETELDPTLQSLDQSDHSTAMQTEALSARDLELIETFLQRRLSLDTEVRSGTAARIVEHLRSKAALSPGPGQSYEDFLQQVARAIRDRGR